MRFMKTTDHAFKVTGRVFPDGAEINMYAHDDADGEPGENMQQVGQVKAAEPQKAVYCDLGVQQAPAGKNDKGDENIHQDDIRNLLQRIEFTLFRDGKRSIFLPENSDRVIDELFFKTDNKFFYRNYIICTIGSEEISNKKKCVTDRQKYSGKVVNGYGGIEFNHRIRIGKLNTKAGNYQCQAE